jgi:hypothetical protein
MNNMATVNPIGAMPAPTARANPRAKSASLAASVTDTVRLTTAAQRPVLTVTESMLEDTATRIQLLQSALSRDPTAKGLLEALASIPAPQLP